MGQAETLSLHPNDPAFYDNCVRLCYLVSTGLTPVGVYGPTILLMNLVLCSERLHSFCSFRQNVGAKWPSLELQNAAPRRNRHCNVSIKEDIFQVNYAINKSRLNTTLLTNNSIFLFLPRSVFMSPFEFQIRLKQMQTMANVCYGRWKNNVLAIFMYDQQHHERANQNMLSS